MVFEETELRLGLPGNTAVAGQGADQNINGGGVEGNGRKRGYSETLQVDLKLKLSSKETSLDDKTTLPPSSTTDDPLPKPPPKAQIIGWPPVQSFRKNILTVQKASSEEVNEKSSGGLVKVSMDGAPYLRKVDLRIYQTYQQLSDALAKMFSSFTTIGNCGSQGLKDFMNESKLMDLLNGSDYVPTYEDKDGDWMLVGDVPWEMFVESCKRLRIMKGTDAIGLAPRAVEKCKKRG